MTAYRFIEPVDVLYLRGNQLFGEPGSYGASLVPPWPSVAAGAIRSRMLVDDGIDLNAFKNSEVTHPTLGTPDAPGSFTLNAFHLARRMKGQVELLVAPPADLVISRDDEDKLQVQRLTPTASTLQSSAALPLLPVLAQAERNKPESGFWLTQAGWQAYLAGQCPSAQQLIKNTDLWKTEGRVGIGMSADTGSVATGKLFTTQAVRFANDVGFIVGVTGAEPPANGLLRFGGDGRGAQIETVSPPLPAPDYNAIARAQRGRLVLTSPAIFTAGWRPNGVAADGTFNLGGVHARLISAAVPRYEVVSGWDLANHCPKTALRAAPTGSVYWLNNLQATAEQLRKLVESGLWSNPCEDDSRRAEGFNRFTLAAW